MPHFASSFIGLIDHMHVIIHKTMCYVLVYLFALGHCLTCRQANEVFSIVHDDKWFCGDIPFTIHMAFVSQLSWPNRNVYAVRIYTLYIAQSGLWSEILLFSFVFFFFKSLWWRSGRCFEEIFLAWIVLGKMGGLRYNALGSFGLLMDDILENQWYNSNILFDLLLNARSKE